jgi:hypothetical protein
MKAYKVIQRIPATATYVFEVAAESEEAALEKINNFNSDTIGDLIDQDYWIELDAEGEADTFIEEMKIQ